MREPGSQVTRANAFENVRNRAAQVFGGAMCEAAQVMLYEAPARFDRTEIGRVRRQEEEASTHRFHQFPDDGCVVGSEVVQDDHVAGIEARRERVAHELDESRAVHGTDEELVTENAVCAHSADHRKVLAPVPGLVVVDALASWGAPVGHAHREIAAGLVEHDEPIQLNLAQRLPELDALRLDFRPVLL